MIFHAPIKQQAAFALCVSLAVLVSVTSIYSLWQWRNDWVLAHSSIQTTAMATTHTSVELIAAIPEEHLFGKSLSQGEVPITSLQLRVTGIVKVNTEQNGEFSKVYISIAGQPSKIYQIGDSLPYGVKIDDITAEAVILENDGRLEKLPLPREKLQFKANNQEEH